MGALVPSQQTIGKVTKGIYGDLKLGDKSVAEIAAQGGVTGGQDLPKPPPLPPDLSDEIIRKAQEASKRRQYGKSGLQSTFASGLMGDTSNVSVASKSLLGS